MGWGQDRTQGAFTGSLAAVLCRENELEEGQRQDQTGQVTEVSHCVWLSWGIMYYSVGCERVNFYFSAFQNYVTIGSLIRGRYWHIKCSVTDASTKFKRFSAD